MVGVGTKEEVVKYGTPAAMGADCEGDKHHLLLLIQEGADDGFVRHELNGGVNLTTT